MSFFHFPYKEPQRFAQWIDYSQKPSFKQLDLKGIRNKVVCSDHFRDEHFMNYQKNKLTRTAMPTLGRYRFNRILVLDYAKSLNPVAEKLPKPILAHLIPPADYEIPKWSPDYECSLDSNSNDGNESTDDDVFAKELTLSVEKICPTKSSFEKDMFDVYDLQGISDQPTEELPLPKRVYKLSPLKPLSKKRKMVVQKNNTKVLNNISKIVTKPDDIFRIPVDIINLSDPGDILEFEDKKPVQYRETQTQTTPGKVSLPDHDKLLLKQKVQFESTIQELEAALEMKNRELLELKRKSDDKECELQEKIAKMTELQSRDSSSQKPGVLTKAQLYNGLKKYLCPAMATLVRMEMFGGAEREWKKDEKMASIDLLKLGDGVFNYFRDEWRIHLPAKKDVKEWTDNSDQFDDEEL